MDLMSVFYLGFNMVWERIDHLEPQKWEPWKEKEFTQKHVLMIYNLGVVADLYKCGNFDNKIICLKAPKMEKKKNAPQNLVGWVSYYLAKYGC